MSGIESIELARERDSAADVDVACAVKGETSHAARNSWIVSDISGDLVVLNESIAVE